LKYRKYFKLFLSLTEKGYREKKNRTLLKNLEELAHSSSPN